MQGLGADRRKLTRIKRSRCVWSSARVVAAGSLDPEVRSSASKEGPPGRSMPELPVYTVDRRPVVGAR